jgi:hypothetical protein
LGVIACCEEKHGRWSKDEMMAHLNQHLMNGTNLSELKSLFATGE